jgi:peptide/nickel transport system substrate-binding protein
MRLLLSALALLLAATTASAQTRSETLIVLYINAFGGWLNYPEYFFFWNFHGQNAVFNTSSYQNPEMDRLIDTARFDTDPKKYMEDVKGFARIAIADVPRTAVYQPLLDVAMRKSVKGYQYWFHRQLDYRQLSKE